MKTHEPRRQGSHCAFLTKKREALVEITGLGGGSGKAKVKMRGLKLWKIIVRGLNRVFEAKLSAFKGGGLESNNTHSVWSVELLSKQAIVRMQGLAIRGHRGGEKSYPQDQQR